MARRTRSTPSKASSAGKSKPNKSVRATRSIPPDKLVEPDNPAEPDKPVLFISHRHSDKEIASVFHEVLKDWSDNRVDIVQTSYAGNGLTIGEKLNKELLARLERAGVLLLIYTSADEDWSYCMWEAGAAVDTRHPGSTRITVAYCMGKTPKVFGDDVMVNARELTDLHNFTKQYLTNPDFFPTYGRPLSEHDKDGPVVKNRAETLYKKLQEALPTLDERQPSDWPAWPRIRFELSFEEIGTITGSPREQGCRQIIETARIVEHDKNAARLIKKVSLDELSTLKQLVEAWRTKLSANGQDADDDWCHSLCGQIFDAADENYPSPEWKQLCDVDRRGWYLPMLMHVYTRPAEACKQFDVYFPRIHVVSGGEYKVSLPNDPEGS